MKRFEGFEQGATLRPLYSANVAAHAAAVRNVGRTNTNRPGQGSLRAIATSSIRELQRPLDRLEARLLT